MTRTSVPHTDVDVTFPHYTSLLPYFGNHPPALEKRDHHDLPSEKTSSTGAYELLQARIDNDDESKYGFWGELDETKSSSEVDPSYNKRSFVSELATFCCFWCAFSVLMLGAFGIYFAVDLAFSRYGLGTGMAEWAIHRHQLPPSTSYGIKFCLESPNREAPSAQAWRYMRAAAGNFCATDTIDFILDSKEAWKVQPGASLVLRNEEPYLDQLEKTQTPTVSREQVQVP
ncbi:hypothetical protein CC77DRAFT_944011 [Alternaria alternata]|uniref:Uncharacterized protein n=1 Tax=Alternaria alternata TaxID=5599 RepID=A0A177DC97_ALTAL|nr:hypothetical protein CC77DRAFT_944011 [Alternaria alternata]OAG16469.1 hypothetical protein CC77DRAFT_944011 [Alternaria alternata]